MNLEAIRSELLTYGYYPMIKNPVLRGMFFDLYTNIGVDVCKKCPSQWYPAYQRLNRMNFQNIKPMSERKYNFKKGYSIRKRDIVYDNTNLTDEIAEQLMDEEEDYIPFFEINSKFAIIKISENDEGEDNQENSQEDINDEDVEDGEQEPVKDEKDEKIPDEQGVEEEDQADGIAELRAKYEKLTGEKPGGRTKKATLIKKIEEAEAALND